MELIIAEKKGVAEAISEAFGNFKKNTGYFESESYILTWASGHLLELKEPHEVDERFKVWRLEDLPIKIDENWEIRPKIYALKDGISKEEKERLVNSQKSIDRQLNLIEKFLKDKCVKKIIHAGDPDSEGQLLIDELIQYFDCKKEVMRVLINDNNPHKIREVFKNIESNTKYLSLGKSAYARALADMYLGVNASRFFTLKSKLNDGRINVGRVKTPVLGLIVNRYDEIKNHVKSYYYISESEIEIVENPKMRLKLILVPIKDILENGKVVQKSLLEDIQKNIVGTQKLIITKEIIRKDAPLPFNLIELQQYCNKKWGYSSDEVMKITQELRDKYKAITYNRSDCQYLSFQHFKEAPQVMQKIIQNLKISNLNLEYTKVSKCFNDKYITAHHAIIPTEVDVDLNKLNEEQKNVYVAIAKYYIIQFLNATTIEKTLGEVKIGEDILLKASSNKILEYGYREFLDDKDLDEQKEESTALSSLLSGEYDSKIISNKILEKETAPKKLYTEATLLKDMTSISKYVKNAELKEALKDKDRDKKGESGGIGTPATRSTVIKDLFRDRYIQLKGKEIEPTELGIKVYNYIADEVKTANVTAEWWIIQREIENGALISKLLKKVEDDFLNVMSRDYERLENKTNSGVVIGQCPKCSLNVTESKKAYNCSCGLLFWKNEAISLKMFKDLLKGEIVSAKGLKSKSGKSYNAKIKLRDDYNGFKVVEFF